MIVSPELYVNPSDSQDGWKEIRISIKPVSARKYAKGAHKGRPYGRAALRRFTKP